MSPAPALRRPLMLAVAVLAWAAGEARAQTVALSALGGAGQPRSTVLLEGGQERVAGVWVGGVVELELGPVTITAKGFRGELVAVDNTPALERDAGEMSGHLRVMATSWLGMEGGFTVRAFSSAAGYQTWTIPSVGLVLSGQLGPRALRAYARAAYLPQARISGLPSPELGIAAGAGLRIAPPGTPLVLEVEYQLERYDFPGGAATRLEQFDQLTVAAGFRVASRR